MASSADGNTLAVSTVEDTAKINIYKRLATSQPWQLVHQISPQRNSDLLSFGDSIALSSDGRVLAVGAVVMISGRRINTIMSFEWNGVDWNLRESDTTQLGRTATSHCECDISLSADGSVMAVGKWMHRNLYKAQGAVYVYDWVDTRWVKRGNTLRALDAAENDYFGKSVALSADANLLVVGARGWESATSKKNGGGVYIYVRSGDSWVQRGEVLIGTPQRKSEWFGFFFRFNWQWRYFNCRGYSLESRFWRIKSAWWSFCF